MKIKPLLLAITLSALALHAKSNTDVYDKISAGIPELIPGFLSGYLDPKVLPNSRKLIYKAPAPGSAAQKYDDTVSAKYLKLRGTARWKLAAKDADLTFPNAAKAFSCALGVPIDKEHTPHLYLLLQRMMNDAGLSTYAAKNQYQRLRPFLVNNQPICTPKEKDRLKKSGSYPSGHSAKGWATALILAEIAPDRADTILARGRAYGENRLVCNVHWYSDVIEGRFMGASTVARLHANAQFMADLEAAKKEVEQARKKGLSPNSDCKFEEEALAIRAE